MNAEAGASKRTPKTTRGRIRRGQACTSCRQLKIKCDGAKPKCGPCTRIRRMNPCEYDDEQSAARIRSLEQEVAELNKRIWELEHPDQATPSSPQEPSSEVLLRLPYPTPSTSSSQESQLPLTENTRTVSDSNSAPHLETEESGFSPLSRVSVDTGARQTSRFSSPGRDSPTSGVSFERRAALVQTFLANCEELGFFLDTARILSIISPQATNTPSEPPSPAVLACAYLWGLHLLHSRSPHAAESIFLEQALKLTATSLLGQSNSTTLLDTIQAHILLALYLLRAGKFDLARIHSNGAVSLVITHRLHEFSPENSGKAVWQVFIFEKIMASSLNSVSDAATVAGGFEASGVIIDIPWPGDAPLQGGIDRVGSFLSGRSDDTTSSVSALYLKSVILFHHAYYLASQWVLDLHRPPIQLYTALNNRIEAFQALLPSDITSKRVLLIHSLVHGATIRLHLPFAAGDPVSSQKCLRASQRIVELASQLIAMDQGSGWCDPAFGTIWTDACFVFVGEIKRSRGSGSLLQAEERNYANSLRGLDEVMVAYSPGSVLMNLQRSKVADALTTLSL